MTQDPAKPSGKPLGGVRVIELVGLGPGPYCGQLMADLGAEVIAIDRPGPRLPLISDRGKRPVTLDLRRDGAADAVLKLCETADALIEGFRPGVAERLGVGPEAAQARNPALVYGRMTGWGQTGPWAGMAGHDLNYIGLTGALLAMGENGAPPPPPLNLVGDYGGGSLFLAFGVVSALLTAKQTGRGAVVDAAIVDGVASMMGVVHSLGALGQWTPARRDNLLDGGAPFYRCYTCKDGGYLAVAPLEPQFFREMLKRLDIAEDEYGAQLDKAEWPRQHALLEEVFARRTRDEWAALFDGVDACVTPVLSYEEAETHPQGRARGLYEEAHGRKQPKTAPVVGGGAEIPLMSAPGAETEAVLKEAGFSEEEIAALTAPR